MSLSLGIAREHAVFSDSDLYEIYEDEPIPVKRT
jgi:hypothetical protein